MVQQLTQVSKQHFRLSQVDLHKVKPISELAIFASCFDLVLKNADELAHQACKAPVDDYMLMLKWYSELTKVGTTADVYKRLIEFKVKNKFSDSALIACLTNTLRVYGVDTPCFKHIAVLLRQSGGKVGEPGLVTFLKLKKSQ